MVKSRWGFVRTETLLQTALSHGKTLLGKLFYIIIVKYVIHRSTPFLLYGQYNTQSNKIQHFYSICNSFTANIQHLYIYNRFVGWYNKNR